MTVKRPVQPGYGSGVTVTPAAGTVTSSITSGSKQAILTNLGANVCYVRIGQTGLGAASTADYPVPAGAQLVISKAEADDKMSHISALGTTLHVMTGEGF